MNKISNRRVYTKGCKFLGSGAYGSVYRISPKRIVKVYNLSEISIGFLAEKQRLAIELRYARDEIRGSKRYAFGLPVLQIVMCINGHGKKHIGVIKKYLPKSARWKDLDKAYKFRQRPWDDGCRNYRRDNNGKLYMIDTQINPYLIDNRLYELKMKYLKSSYK
jgi:hypothetical protein